MHLSDHDGLGGWHIHFSRNGAPAKRRVGQQIAAQFALVTAGDPAVTLGRCAAAGCGNYFVDQSRNRTQRFCSNACAAGRQSRPIGPARRRTPRQKDHGGSAGAVV
ncbi:CGNR zinc finger domain-containing protein [Streptomyces flaveolus]|uniref:CGNR zinc finger domain-containing protein n=1 Tax=Streptomyces flaveolus TaxID=67297 RepID=UPI0036ABD996